MGKTINLRGTSSGEGNYQDILEKGQANGYAGLDANGKVPATQLPNSVMEYQGLWSPITNTPTLADGAGNTDTAIGNVYKVSIDGTINLGSGSITYQLGDYVILNASKIWEKSSGASGTLQTDDTTADGNVSVALLYDDTRRLTITRTTGTITVTLPAKVVGKKCLTELQFRTGATVPTLTNPTGDDASAVKWAYNINPSLEANTRYVLVYERLDGNTILGSFSTFPI